MSLEPLPLAEPFEWVESEAEPELEVSPSGLLELESEALPSLEPSFEGLDEEPDVEGEDELVPSSRLLFDPPCRLAFALSVVAGCL